MSRTPRAARWVARLRIASYLTVVLVVGYGLWRFDVVGLPPEGCSPLADFDPGDRLVVDVRARSWAQGQALLYRSPAGDLLLGRVSAPPAFAREEVEAGALWIESERSDCPSPDSRTFGVLPPEAVAGRVAFALPW